jgi:hypothetical protein
MILQKYTRRMYQHSTMFVIEGAAVLAKLFFTHNNSIKEV